MFIFQPSCFALASQAAAIFFAVATVSVGLVSIAVAAEAHRITPATVATAPCAQQIVFIFIPSPLGDSADLSPLARGEALLWTP
jgi:hypothetical protein